MRELLTLVDRALRGRFTDPERLRSEGVVLSAPLAARAALLLGGIYGACMGLYGATRAEDPAIAQLIASTVKTPLLFLITLVVTVPSLYVASALARSPLDFASTLKLLMVGVLIDLAMLASLGPITAFFTLSTDSYPFLVLLNVAFFAAGGLVGLAVLRRAVDAMFAPQAPVIGPPLPPGTNDPNARRRRIAERVFWTWTVVYGVVGAQTGWILRPFIGAPGLPFTWFRERDSNVLEAVLHTLGNLFA